VEGLRLVGVVQRERVDHEVGLVGQDRLERLVEGREVGAAAAAVADLPPAGLLRVQPHFEHLHERVAELDALPLREGVAEDHDPPDALRLGSQRLVAEPQGVVAELHGPRRASRHRVVPQGGDVQIALPALGGAQVDVEVVPGVRGIAVEQQSPPGVGHASRHQESLGRNPEHADDGLADEEEGHDRRHGEDEAEEHLPTTRGHQGSGHEKSAL
jgi:hypothetical protein